MEKEQDTGYQATVEPELEISCDTEQDDNSLCLEKISNPTQDKPLQVHLDKWLWAARFFKTLALARKAIQSGKIYYNGQRSRSCVEISVGGLLRIQHGSLDRLVVVTGLSTRRRSMADAAALYQDISHHQETLRQMADSYQPTSYRPRSRHPYHQTQTSSVSQHTQSDYRTPYTNPVESPSLELDVNFNRPNTDYRSPEPAWQRPKKTIRYLRKPINRPAGLEVRSVPKPEYSVEEVD